MFSIMAVQDDVVVGVVVVGLPKARLAMDGWTLEITRLATNGTRNACSLLYGAARRAAFALGYTRILTYTLASENGSSLRASGFSKDADVFGESWKRRSQNGGRFIDDRNPTGDKIRWVAGFTCETPKPTYSVVDSRQQVLPL
jgi:hypothetical protein